LPGGASYSTCHEEWTEQISASGAYGFVAQAGARYVLTGPIFLSGGVEYTYAPADSDALVEGTTNLGASAFRWAPGFGSEGSPQHIFCNRPSVKQTYRSPAALLPVAYSSQ
jgi:hypothetical protein